MGHEATVGDLEALRIQSTSWIRVETSAVSFEQKTYQGSEGPLRSLEKKSQVHSVRCSIKMPKVHQKVSSIVEIQDWNM